MPSFADRTWTLWGLAGYCAVAPVLIAAGPTWLKVAVSLPAIAAGCWFGLHAYICAHAKLRQQGKSGLWLLVFFGPFVATAVAIGMLPLENVGLVVGAMSIAGPIAMGFAYWGVRALSAKPPTTAADG